MNYFEEMKDEISGFFRSGALLFYIFIGFMAQRGWYMIQGKKISLWQTVGYALIACFVGYLAYNVCPDNKRPWVVPIATLLSDKIMVIITNIRSEDIKKFILKMLGK